MSGARPLGLGSGNVRIANRLTCVPVAVARHPRKCSISRSPNERIQVEFFISAGVVRSWLTVLNRSPLAAHQRRSMGYWSDLSLPSDQFIDRHLTVLAAV